MAKKFMLVITHSTDDQERANSAVALAVSLISENSDLAIFFTFEGALLAVQSWMLWFSRRTSFPADRRPRVC